MSSHSVSITSNNGEEKKKSQNDVANVTETEKKHLSDFSQLESGAGGLKRSPSGHHLLIPQPSNNPDDPLNWTKYKKHVVLLVISAVSFLPDFGSAVGGVTSVVQSNLMPHGEWNIPQTVVNHSLAGNVAMLGFGGIIVIMFSNYFGRAPTMFWFLTISVATAAWCGAAISFDSFMTARILNGFFSTVGQAGGLMFIQDLFFFHEHPRKINIWSGFLIPAPFLGPLVASFIVWKTTWRWVFYTYALLNGLCWLLVVFFMEETYFNRENPAANPKPHEGSRILRLLGTEQWKTRHQRATVKQAILRPLVAILKLPVLLSTVYYLFTFAWVIGLNNQISVFLSNPKLYAFTPKDLGLFYFAPVVGTLLAYILGHWIHDLVGNLYARRHDGHIEPEARLTPILLSTPIMVVGLVIVGVSLQHFWHYMAVAVGFGLFVFGVMIETTALYAYVLDSYPEAPGETSAWLNLGRSIGGFIVSYFEVNWAESEGTQHSLGIQAGIVAASFFIFIVPLFVWGKQIRTKQGRISFDR